jgi:thiamine-phosphate pyrophosphorylase
MDDRRARLQSARLYYICGLDRLATIEPALRGGADVFQLRDKRAPDDELLEAAAAIRAHCDAHQALFIVNDRPDLALAANADGVHLGQDDMAIEEARAAVGPDLLIGRSTHSPVQVDRAIGADYIGVGPINPTPTKRFRPAVGLGIVEHAVAHASVPFFAIGGLDARTLPAAVAAGATRAAVVRAISEAPDPEAATRMLRALVAVEDRVG